MAKRMKRKESLELKPKGNQIASEIDCEEKKKGKMVVIISNKKKIIFSKIDKL